MATIAAIVGFTSSSSIIRLAAPPVMLAIVWLIIPSCLDRMGTRFDAHQVGADIMMHMFQSVEVALLSNWSFEAGGPNRRYAATVPALEGVAKMNLAELLWERLMFGVHVAFSPRMTSTPYEVKNLPRFSAVDPNYMPARTAFLVRTARTVLLSYLPPGLVDLVGGQPEKNAARFSPQAVPSHAADHVHPQA
ncbi:MAG: hypothetical protein M1816_003102 [Peltula sp. TS41687]|nr:MAG: hypothetical protein M1816_003102 [Peltula sp. TS41687]